MARHNRNKKEEEQESVKRKGEEDDQSSLVETSKEQWRMFVIRIFNVKKFENPELW